MEITPAYVEAIFILALARFFPCRRLSDHIARQFLMQCVCICTSMWCGVVRKSHAHTHHITYRTYTTHTHTHTNLFFRENCICCIVAIGFVSISSIYIITRLLIDATHTLERQAYAANGKTPSTSSLSLFVYRRQGNANLICWIHCYMHFMRTRRQEESHLAFSINVAGRNEKRLMHNKNG